MIVEFICGRFLMWYQDNDTVLDSFVFFAHEGSHELLRRNIFNVA
jgi:hypothetical protein